MLEFGDKMQSSINRTTTEANNGLMLHEAWTEIILNDTVSKIQNISLKIGRQEIAYDDQKVIRWFRLVATSQKTRCSCLQICQQRLDC